MYTGPARPPLPLTSRIVGHDRIAVGYGDGPLTQVTSGQVATARAALRVTGRDTVLFAGVPVDESDLASLAADLKTEAARHADSVQQDRALEKQEHVR